MNHSSIYENLRGELHPQIYKKTYTQEHTALTEKYTIVSPNWCRNTTAFLMLNV
jgi:hypothetical protein